MQRYVKIPTNGVNRDFSCYLCCIFHFIRRRGDRHRGGGKRSLATVTIFGKELLWKLGGALSSNEGKKRAFLHKPARTSSRRIPLDGYGTKEAVITKPGNARRPPPPPPPIKGLVNKRSSLLLKCAIVNTWPSLNLN